MKLNQEHLDITTNIPAGQIQQISLPTEGIAKQVIIKLLTTNLYQYPEESTVREICSNAIDANTENGKGSTPIRITVPTLENPYLIIQDFGKGIDQERYSGYLRLGDSTKRDNNDEIGGFGIGRMSMLTLAEQVLIESVANGVKYRHLLRKDQDGLPSGYTISSEPSSELSGTTIKIPVSRYSMDKVRAAVLKLAPWFKTVPHITDPALNRQIQETVASYKLKRTSTVSILQTVYRLDSDDPIQVRQETQVEAYYLPSGNSKLKVAVVNGSVFYNLPVSMTDAINRKLNERELELGYTVTGGVPDLVIRFPIGSLTLTTERENLSSAVANEAVVSDVVAQVMQQLEEILRARFNSLPSFKHKLRVLHSYPFDSFGHEGRLFSKARYPFSAPTGSIRLKLEYLDSKFALIEGDTEGMEVSQARVLWDQFNAMSRGASRVGNSSRWSISTKSKDLFAHHFVEAEWVVASTGMTTVGIRKRATAAGIAPEKPLFVVPADNPVTTIENSFLLKCMGAIPITPNSSSTKTKENKVASTRSRLNSAVKGGGVRQLLPHLARSFSDVYYATEKRLALPEEGGLYAVTEVVKDYMSHKLLHPELDYTKLYFVTPTIEAGLHELNSELPEPIWIKWGDYTEALFLQESERYKRGLGAIGYCIESDWFYDQFVGDRRASEFLMQVLAQPEIKAINPAVAVNLSELLYDKEVAQWMKNIACCPYLGCKWDNKSKETMNRFREAKTWDLTENFTWCERENFIFAQIVRRYPMLKYWFVSIAPHYRQGDRPYLTDLLNYLKHN